MTEEKAHVIGLSLAMGDYEVPRLLAGHLIATHNKPTEEQPYVFRVYSNEESGHQFCLYYREDSDFNPEIVLRKLAALWLREEADKIEGVFR